MLPWPLSFFLISSNSGMEDATRRLSRFENYFLLKVGKLVFHIHDFSNDVSILILGTVSPKTNINVCL